MIGKTYDTLLTKQKQFLSTLYGLSLQQQEQSSYNASTTQQRWNHGHESVSIWNMEGHSFQAHCSNGLETKHQQASDHNGWKCRVFSCDNGNTTRNQCGLRCGQQCFVGNQRTFGKSRSQSDYSRFDERVPDPWQNGKSLSHKQNGKDLGRYKWFLRSFLGGTPADGSDKTSPRLYCMSSRKWWSLSRLSFRNKAATTEDKTDRGSTNATSLHCG